MHKLVLKAFHLVAFVLVIAGTQAVAESLDAGLSAAQSQFFDSLRFYNQFKSSSPNSEKTLKVRARTILLGQHLIRDSVRKLEELRKAAPGRQTGLELLLEDIPRTVKDSMRDAGITFRYLIDPAKPLTSNNIWVGDVDTAAMSANRVALESPKHMRYRLSQMAAKAGGAVQHFSTQYALFSISFMMLTVGQLGVDYEKDPAAWDHFMDSLKDPWAAASFAVFIAAAHPVGKMIDGVRSGVVAKSMIPFAAMVAGSLAASLFHDLVSDKDLHACSRYVLTARENKTAEGFATCERSFSKWAVHNKIIQYGPQIISLVTSFGMATALRGGLTMAAKSRPASIVFEGVGIATRSMASKLGLGARLARGGGIAASGGFNPGSVAIAVGDFFVFLLFYEIVAEPITEKITEQKLLNLELPSRLDEKLFHSDYWIDRKANEQPIADALDVRATTLNSVQGFVNALADQQKKAGLSALMAQDCRRFTADPAANAPKSSAQLDCEVSQRPAHLLLRYAQLNHQWRDHLLSSFYTSRDNWSSLVEQFNVLYVTAYELGSYLAEQRFLFDRGQIARPDLSETGLLQAMGSSAALLQSSDYTLSVYGSLGTPNLLSFLLASFACETSTERLHTPWGSGFDFVPPKIVNESANVCNSVWVTWKKKTPFLGSYIDETGRKYTSLAEYIFDHLKPELLGSGRFSNFPAWWNQNVTSAVAPVWTNYQDSYLTLVKDKFLPVLLNQDLLQGQTYPGSYGVLRSYQGEMAQYFSLLEQLHPDFPVLSVKQAVLRRFENLRVADELHHRIPTASDEIRELLDDLGLNLGVMGGTERDELVARIDGASRTEESLRADLTELLLGLLNDKVTGLQALQQSFAWMDFRKRSEKAEPSHRPSQPPLLRGLE